MSIRPMYSIEKRIEEDDGTTLRLVSIKLEDDQDQLKKGKLLVYETVDKSIKEILINGDISSEDIHPETTIEDLKDIDTILVIAGNVNVQLGIHMFEDKSLNMFITGRDSVESFEVSNLTDYLKVKQIFYKKVEESILLDSNEKK